MVAVVAVVAVVGEAGRIAARPVHYISVAD